MCLITYTPSHEDVWGKGAIAPPFLPSALDGGKWSLYSFIDINTKLMALHMKHCTESIIYTCISLNIHNIEKFVKEHCLQGRDAV
jgi:hypothetical protein